MTPALRTRLHPQCFSLRYGESSPFPFAPVARGVRLSVYITPSHKTEAKDTLDISVYPKKESSKIKNFSFSTKLNNGRHSVADFLTDLHKTITDGVKQAENKNVNNIAKPSKLKDFKMWCKNVTDRIKGNN